MYRELVGHERGKLSDIAICMFAFVVILLFEPALVLASLPQAAKTVGQSILVILIFVFCIWFYRHRLRSIRYTVITSDTERFGELEDAPESFSEFEEGSFFAENTVGMGAGTYLCIVHARELRAFYTPGQQVKLDEVVRIINASISKRSESCALVYEQDGEMICAYISPSETLCTYLAELCEKNNKTESE